MKLYKEELSIDQIMIFEYFADIATFSSNGIFQIKKKTIASALRLNRRRIDSLLDWLKDIKVIVERPKSVRNVRTFFFNFTILKKNPEIIFSNGIPNLPQYKRLSERAFKNRRLQIFKEYRQ